MVSEGRLTPNTGASTPAYNTMPRTPIYPSEPLK
eukprot:SAG31_NODE_36815_length_310_cov_0.620853_1_plen_33_part_01